jgi:hypothetical protein
MMMSIAIFVALGVLGVLQEAGTRATTVISLMTSKPIPVMAAGYDYLSKVLLMIH